MKALKLAVIACTLILAGCSAKVLHTATADSYKAEFTDAKCDIKLAKDFARAIGVPEKVIEEMKQGTVEFKDGIPQRKFCYVDAGKGAFIIDDAGEAGEVFYDTGKK